jgi:hypothetical protein
MGKRIAVPFIVGLGIATPAKPCSEPVITIDPVPLLTDGATVPTNPVVVGFARFANLVRVTPEDGVAEDRIVDEAGRIFLEPERAYTIAVRDVSARVVTGPGPDDTPPPPPTLLGTHIEHTDDRWVWSICDSPPIPRYFPGRDVVVADVDLGDEGVAAVTLDDSGTPLAVSRDGSVFVGSEGIGRVAIIDAAGNRSDVIEIDLDAALAADAGGCAQMSATPIAPVPFALAGLWLRRGRRRASSSYAWASPWRTDCTPHDRVYRICADPIALDGPCCMVRQLQSACGGGLTDSNSDRLCIGVDAGDREESLSTMTAIGCVDAAIRVWE